MNLTNLSEKIEECKPDRIFVLTDDNTHRHCLPLLADMEWFHDAHVITIPAGDRNKTLDTAAKVWTQLQQHGASRHSLLINLGGGMVTDLGGFAASTFKRGIRFINIPTTLLSMVDAAFGGKTGVNFGGLKNEIGVFNSAKEVIVDVVFLNTLDRENLLSGYAEMLKHALLADIDSLSEHLLFSPLDILNSKTSSRQAKNDSHSSLQELVEFSIAIKERVVEADPHEQGIRKALNLGHTFGHTIESFSMKKHSSTGAKPLLHGYAVAFGLICELYLSAVRLGFSTDIMRQVVSYIREHYGITDITCNDYPELIELMHHDKKNKSGDILCTLLAAVGDIQLDQKLSEEDIKEAFDFLREG